MSPVAATIANEFTSSTSQVQTATSRAVKSAAAAPNAALSSAAPLATESTSTAPSPAPSRTTATPPAGAVALRYGTPAFASADFTTSQDFVKALRPTGSNWNEQSAGSATTVTGAAATARSSAGFA